VTGIDLGCSSCGRVCVRGPVGCGLALAATFPRPGLSGVDLDAADIRRMDGKVHDKLTSLHFCQELMPWGL